MEERLSVIIDADIKQLQSELNKAKTTITQFTQQAEKGSTGMNVGFRKVTGIIEGLTNKAKGLQTALKNATSETRITALNKELHITNSELARLKTLGVASGLNKATQSFDGLTKSVGNSNGVAIEFSRIIQDAPFGIIGIGNNIQQLTANFAQLKASSTSTGAALKASLAAIISPANLLVLGISAITAAFTAYQMGAFDSILGNKELEESFESLNDEIDNTIESLNNFEKASLNASKGAIKEKTELDSLFSILQDTNLEQSVRIGAYNKLISTYPTLIKGLTQEKALTGDLTTEYNLLADAIEKKASAAAIEDVYIESLKESFDTQKQLNKETRTLAEINQDLLNIQSQIRSAEVKGSGVAKGRIVGLKNQEESLESQLEKQKQVVELTKTLIGAQGEQARQLKSDLVEVNKELAKLFGFGENEKPDPTPEKLGLISSLTAQISDLNEQRDLSKDQEEINLLTGKINLLEEQLGLINDIAKRANTPVDLGIDTSGLPARDGNIGMGNLPTQGIIIPNTVQNQFDAIFKAIEDNEPTLLERLTDLATNIDNLLENELGRAFANFGSSIGKALIEGTSIVNAIGQAFLGSMASFLGKFGEQLIAYGVAGLAFSKATKAMTNPITAAPAAIAAIAAGTAMTLAAGAIGSIAKGGFNGGSGGSGGGTGASQSFGGGMAPTAGLSQSHGFANPSTFSRGRMDITLNARIGNDAIYLSNKSEENKRNRI